MKKRVISAAILLLLLIIFMAFNSKIFAIFILLCSLLGLNEFLNIKFKEKKPKIINIIAVLSVTFMVLNNIFYQVDYMITLLLPLLLLTIPIVFYNNNEIYSINDALFVVGAVLFIGLSFGTIITLRDISIANAVYIFIIAFITDTYAYIAGSLIGKHQLTSISPKKTYEGSVIGAIVGTVVGSVFYYNLIGNISVTSVIMLSFLLAIISEVGDLVFSSIKRYYNVKDYSNLIPGHGGILDRFDSVIFVSLVVALIFRIF